MKKPIIGITLDIEKKKTYSKFPWYALRENYLTSLTKFNAIPFPLLHENKYISDFCDLIDGLIITGGDFDIDPKIYKENNTESKYIKNKRTKVEINIFNKFFKL
jgi:Predicted glutamine amidotransferases